MKIRPAGTELFHADGWTYGQTDSWTDGQMDRGTYEERREEDNSRYSQLCERA
jgi:hypothetical protein